MADDAVDDLDAALPLAMDVQADFFEDGCRHLLDLLLQPPSASSDELLSEEEGASLLSHLTILHRGYCSSNDNVASSTTTGLLWSPTSVNLVRARVRLIMTSLCRGGGGGRCGVDRVMIVDGKMARRLLTDGILPLAS
jgi:hypothetical protein